MRNIDDTQPSRSFYLQNYDPGSKGPPRLLFCGVIFIFVMVILGAVGAVAGFRHVLRPAQQQRVIDQLPFMRMFLQATPAGGVFPTLEPRSDAGDAMALLEMPLIAPSPTAAASAAAVIATAGAPAESSTVPPTSRSLPEPVPTVDLRNEQEPAAPATPPSVVTDSPNVSVATVAPPVATLPSTGRIYGMLHHQQTWNNCGPATITMALSYYGWQQDQSVAGGVLKPNREDKNVSPHELATFVEENSSVKAIVRMGGTLDLLKRLVANGFPVVIETGAMFEAYDWIGHYRALVAYDDNYQLFYFFDSFLGVGEGARGVSISYSKVDRDWQAFNRTFIVVYEPQREGLLRSVMDSHWSEQTAAEIALNTAREEARREPNNAFAWFNMGTSLVALERYQEAATAFDRAQQLGELPWRMMWYQFGAFEAFYEVGRYDDVLSLVRINLNNAEEIEETYYWQGRVQEAQGNSAQAASSYRRALAYNRNYREARAALENLS